MSNRNRSFAAPASRHDEDERIRNARDITPAGSSFGLPADIKVPENRPSVRAPTNIVQRVQARGQIKGQELVTQFERELKQTVEAQADREAAERKRGMAELTFRLELPFKLQEVVLGCHTNLAKAQGLYNQAVHEVHQGEIDRANDAALRQQQHLTRQLEEQVRQLRAQNEADLLRIRNSRVAELGDADAEQQLAERRARTAEFRARTSEFRSREESFRPKPQPGQSEGPPKAMRVHLRAGDLKNESWEWTRAQIDEILASVGGDRRKLSARGRRELDRLEEALRRTEEDIDSGEASDFLGEDDE